MSVRLAEREWPDIDDRPRSSRERPPVHPTEKRFTRRLRVGIIFGLGIAATLVWQTWAKGPRQAVADRFPKLGWIAPAAVASPGPDGSVSAEQLASIAHNLVLVRQSVDRVSADVAKLQAAKAESRNPTTSAPAPAAAPRKPAAPTTR